MIERQGELIFVHAESMRALYDALRAWQAEGERRGLRQLEIQPEDNGFSAIGLVGPQPAVLTSRDGTDTAVVHDGRLLTGMG